MNLEVHDLSTHVVVYIVIYSGFISLLLYHLVNLETIN
jgi:hypothetical protein